VHVQGGNAIDACVAVAATQCTLAANSYVSFAGVAKILYYEAASNTTYDIDGDWNSVLANNPSNIPPLQPRNASTVGAGVLVPGFVAAMAFAAQRFGAFPLSSLLEPALYFAQTGVSVYPELAALISTNAALLTSTPEGARIFVNPATGKLYAAGENFTQPQLAAFLANVSAAGAAYVYGPQAPWAAAAVEALAAAGSNITATDFERYEVELLAPLTANLSNGVGVDATNVAFGGVDIVEQLLLLDVSGVSAGSTQPYMSNGTLLFWLVQFTRWSTQMSSIVHAAPSVLPYAEGESCAPSPCAVVVAVDRCAAGTGRLLQHLAVRCRTRHARERGGGVGDNVCTRRRAARGPVLL
jgi:gamma-glutamyltranspeptidase/glutathione hydrolase